MCYIQKRNTQLELNTLAGSFNSVFHYFCLKYFLFKLFKSIAYIDIFVFCRYYFCFIFLSLSTSRTSISANFQTNKEIYIFVFLVTGGDVESIKWSNILSITVGISKAIDHLHTGMQKPIVHGNLKSKNVLLLLNPSFEPRVSDFGLHLLLNLTAGQEILDVSAVEGYKAPELIKMKEVSKESDVYSLGVIMLELVSGKEPINENPTGDDEFYLPDFMRNAVLDHRLSDLYRPEILKSDGGDNPSEECVLKYFHLAMSCCSPSPSLRPNIKQVLRKLEEIREC